MEDLIYFGTLNQFKNKEGTQYYVVYYLDKYGVARTDFLDRTVWEKMLQDTKEIKPGTKCTGKYTLNAFRTAVLNEVKKV